MKSKLAIAAMMAALAHGLGPAPAPAPALRKPEKRDPKTSLERMAAAEAKRGRKNAKRAAQRK